MPTSDLLDIDLNPENRDDERIDLDVAYLALQLDLAAFFFVYLYLAGDNIFHPGCVAEDFDMLPRVDLRQLAYLARNILVALLMRTTRGLSPLSVISPRV